MKHETINDVRAAWPAGGAKRTARIALLLDLHAAGRGAIVAVIRRLRRVRPRRPPNNAVVRRAIVAELGPFVAAMPYISTDDLRSPRRLLALYRLAVRRCAVADSEYSEVRWFRLAAYVLRAGRQHQIRPASPPAVGAVFRAHAMREQWAGTGPDEDAGAAMRATLRAAAESDRAIVAYTADLAVQPWRAARRDAELVGVLFSRNYKWPEIDAELGARGWTRARRRDARRGAPIRRNAMP
jgi:hypothetical protein